MPDKIDLNNAPAVAPPHNETVLSVLILELALLRVRTDRGRLPALKTKSNILINEVKIQVQTQRDSIHD